MGHAGGAEITVDGAATGDLRALYGWLADEGGLRVRLVERPLASGEMGGLLDSLAIVLAPGGAAAAFAGTLVSWLRRRRSDLTIRLHRADGAELELSVTQLRGLEPAQLAEVVSSLGGWLDQDDP